MNKNIAILIDSGLSVPQEYIGKDMYVVPLYIHFKNESYKDTVNITSQEVMDKLQIEGVAKTSIPSVGDIKQVIEKIKTDGYKNIIAITISSGLSGVYNAMNIISNEEKDINIKVIDTKNISLSAGFFAIHAQEILNENPDITLEDMYEKLQNSVKSSKVYIYLETLKYLIAGGRIGKVMGSIGTLLKVLPIITCDDDGIYQTIAKVRNIDKAVIEMTNKVKEVISQNLDKKYYLAVVYKRDIKLLEKIKEILKDEIAGAQMFIQCDIVTPAVGVHSGFGALGLCVYAFKG